LRTVQSVGQGRAVTLPEPSQEDAADGEHETETEAGPGALPFMPSLFSGVAERGVGADHAEAPDEADVGSLRTAAAPLRSDVAETDSDRPSHVPTQAAPQAAVAVAGLAPEDLDRLKTALHRLEECRRMLDGASGGG